MVYHPLARLHTSIPAAAGFQRHVRPAQPVKPIGGGGGGQFRVQGAMAGSLSARAAAAAAEGVLGPQACAGHVCTYVTQWLRATRADNGIPSVRGGALRRISPADAPDIAARARER